MSGSSCGHEDYEHIKPHPEPYLAALERFGAASGEAMNVPKRRIGCEVDIRDDVSVKDTHELWPVYDEVFHDKAGESEWLETWEKHCDREGFRAARARLDGDLVGFAYGYTGYHGQWWTDQAAAVLDTEVAAEWLGGHFELVSIGVLPGVRGRSIGQRLLDAVTTGLSQERWLLMTTSVEADPARRLYASRDWSVIGPGLTANTVIMGKRNGFTSR